MALFKERLSLEEFVVATVMRPILHGRLETDKPNMDFLNFGLVDSSNVLTTAERQLIEQEIQPLMVHFTVLEIIELGLSGKITHSPDDIAAMCNNAIYSAFAELFKDDNQAKQLCNQYASLRVEYFDAAFETEAENAQPKKPALGFCRHFVQRVLGPLQKDWAYLEKRKIVFHLAAGVHNNIRDGMMDVMSKCKVV